MEKKTNQIETEELSLKELISDYTKYWYLFVISIIVAYLIALLLFRYETPVYETQATIIAKDGRSGGGELSALSDLSFIANIQDRKKMASEIVIISSRKIISKAVKALDLNVSYYTEGNIKRTEIYKNRNPIKVTYFNADTGKDFRAPKLTISVIDDIKFKLSLGENTTFETYNFGDTIELPFGNIMVSPNLEYKKNLLNDAEIEVFYRPITSVAARYQGRLKTIYSAQSGDVLVLSINSTVPKRAEDFLNELIFQYNEDAIYDKNQIAKNTSDFIKTRLEIISKELDSVETNKELFKSSNRLTDIDLEASMMMGNANEFSNRQVELGTKIELVNSMVSYIGNSAATELIPLSVNVSESEVTSSVSTFNQLVLERNKLLENSTVQNPVIKNIDGQLTHLHASILKSLKTEKRKLQLVLKDLNTEEHKFNSKLSLIPKKEKLFRGIVRQQEIKEQLYLFLLRQREEASISLAVTSPNAKIVDEAISKPLSSKKNMFILGALILGFLVPFGYLFIKNLLNNTVNNRRDVERIIKEIPIIGEIPKLLKKDDELIKENDRSFLAESFRILRTNLQFLFINKKLSVEDSKSIFVTSAIHNEGKTFIAFNLALSLASINKKVILVGADIRNPQLHRYFPKAEKGSEGLTDFIVNNELQINQIIRKSEFHNNLDIMLSGVIPPNPTELLLSTRVEALFNDLKSQYDYIIVDTAPSMLVADTILINKYADTTLFVVRAGYTEKKLLEFLSDTVSEEKLKNVAVVLNDVNSENYGYGNKYGYTYGHRKVSKLKSLFGKS